MEYTYQYPKADITVDCVLFGVTPDWKLQVVMIRRAEDPYKGRWAIPGGFIEFLKGETAYEAAKRELEEETGISLSYLEQLGTFDAPDRDPRGRTFSVAHYGLVRTQDHAAKPGSDASAAEWLSVADVLVLPANSLAFDHPLILRAAVARLQAKVRYAPIGFNLLPETFTMPQLQKLYEAVLMREIDKRNFRKRFKVMEAKLRGAGLDNFLQEVGRETKIGAKSGPAGTLFRFDKQAYDHAVEHGINFEI